jgi:hypothetical protein
VYPSEQKNAAAFILQQLSSVESAHIRYTRSSETGNALRDVAGRCR